MRLAPSARKAAKAAVIGVVTLASGRASRSRAKTRSSPITMAAEVQPNATTASGRPGMITAALSASRPSIAAASRA